MKTNTLQKLFLSTLALLTVLPTFAMPIASLPICSKEDYALAQRHFNSAQRAHELGLTSEVDFSLVKSTFAEVSYCAGEISLLQFCTSKADLERALDGRLAAPVENALIFDRIIKLNRICQYPKQN